MGSTPYAGEPVGDAGWSSAQIQFSTASYGEEATMVTLGPSAVGAAWTTSDGTWWSRSRPDAGWDTWQMYGGLIGSSFQQSVVKLDPSGAPHILVANCTQNFDGGGLNELTYQQPFPDGGVRIDADLLVGSWGVNIPNVDLAFAPDGTARLVLFEDNALLYARGEGDGGFVVTHLTGFGDLPEFPSVAVDPLGTSHLLFSARDPLPDGGKQSHLRHAEGEDGAWTIETVDDGGTRYANSLVIGADGELQALYNEPSGGYSRIWYARRVAGTWHLDAVTPADALVFEKLQLVLDANGDPAFITNEGTGLNLVRW